MVKSLLYATVLSVVFFLTGVYQVSKHLGLNQTYLITLGLNAVFIYCIVFNKSFSVFEKRVISKSEQVWFIKMSLFLYVAATTLLFILTFLVGELLGSPQIQGITRNEFNVVRGMLIVAGGAPISAYVAFIASSDWLRRLLQ